MFLENLHSDHALLSKVMRAFSGYLDALEPDGEEPEELLRFVCFLREFGDMIHHTKEEEVLFPTLASYGFGESQGPLLQVKLQHDQERVLMRLLIQAAFEPRPWTLEQRSQAVKAGRALVAFQTTHLQAENGLLQSEVRPRLTEDEAAELQAALQRFDDTHNLCGHVRWLRSLGAALVARHAVP